MATRAPWKGESFPKPRVLNLLIKSGDVQVQPPSKLQLLVNGNTLDKFLVKKGRKCLDINQVSVILTVGCKMSASIVCLPDSKGSTTLSMQAISLSIDRQKGRHCSALKSWQQDTLEFESCEFVSGKKLSERGRIPTFLLVSYQMVPLMWTGFRCDVFFCNTFF